MSRGRSKGAVSGKWLDRAAAIFARSTPEPNTGCWLWAGGLGSTGYGQAYDHKRGRSNKASRVSFEIFKHPIPDGVDVCHSCDQRSCVNPDHLWLGTRRDNMRDCSAKNRLGGRAVNPAIGEAHHMAKLDDITVECMRVCVASGATSQAEWVRWLGLSPCTISAAVTGRNWTHVTNRFATKAAA